MNIEHRTWNAQRRAPDEHRTSDIERSTSSTGRTSNIGHRTFNVEHWTNIEHRVLETSSETAGVGPFGGYSMFGVHPTFVVECWFFEVRRAFDVGRSMYDVRCSSGARRWVLNVRCWKFVGHSTLSVRCSMFVRCWTLGVECSMLEVRRAFDVGRSISDVGCSFGARRWVLNVRCWKFVGHSTLDGRCPIVARAQMCWNVGFWGGVLSKRDACSTGRNCRLASDLLVDGAFDGSPANRTEANLIAAEHEAVHCRAVQAFGFVAGPFKGADATGVRIGSEQRGHGLLFLAHEAFQSRFRLAGRPRLLRASSGSGERPLRTRPSSRAWAGACRR